MTTKTSGWGCLALLIGTPIMLSYMVFMRAWAIWVLWQWFAVPLGAPRASIWHLAGLSMLLWIVTTEHWLEDRRGRKDDAGIGRRVAWLITSSTFGPLFALAFGYLFRKLAGLA